MAKVLIRTAQLIGEPSRKRTYAFVALGYADLENLRDDLCDCLALEDREAPFQIVLVAAPTVAEAIDKFGDLPEALRKAGRVQ